MKEDRMRLSIAALIIFPLVCPGDVISSRKIDSGGVTCTLNSPTRSYNILAPTKLLS
jgi:hypothetical protein